MTTAERLRKAAGETYNMNLHNDLIDTASELEALTRERDDLKAKLGDLDQKLLATDLELVATKAKLAQVEADAAAMRDVLELTKHYNIGPKVPNSWFIERDRSLATGSGQRLLDELAVMREALTFLGAKPPYSEAVQSMLNELATLRATAQRRLELLKSLEWNGNVDMMRCPSCSRDRAFSENHKPTCPLAQELKEGK